MDHSEQQIGLVRQCRVPDETEVSMFLYPTRGGVRAHVTRSIGDEVLYGVDLLHHDGSRDTEMIFENMCREDLADLKLGKRVIRRSAAPSHAVRSRRRFVAAAALAAAIVGYCGLGNTPKSAQGAAAKPTPISASAE